MKMFWNIFLPILIPAYVLAAGALTDVGYNNYFGIPAEYVNTSPTFYSIFVLNIYTVAVDFIGTVPWWGWIIFVVGVLVAVYICFSRAGRIIVLLIVAFLLLKLLFGMVVFGEIMAKTQTTFEVPASGCAPIGTAANYIIPVISGDNVIVVPVDQSNQISDTFMVKQASDFSCGFGHKDIGAVKN